MYNKVVYHNNNNECDNQSQEIVIKLNTNKFEKVLYYRDEGNMNIVVSLFAHENDEKRVIRFKKFPLDASIDTSNQQNIKNELMSFVRFEALLQKYFENSDHFTVVPKIVYFDVDDLHALNSYLMRDRPVIRRNKIIGHKYGLLYRDVAFLPKDICLMKSLNGEFRDSPTICIEIKTKQGYEMDDETELIFGVKKCRFCYFQYLKLRNARISSVSNYCPIDLFSGNAERMNRAIEGLMENPQNNLKIFLDGKMVFNEYSGDRSALHRAMTSLFPDVANSEGQKILLINLIRKVLIKDFTVCDCVVDVYATNKNDDVNIHLRDCDYKYPQLPRNCILSSILNAQHLVKENFHKMEILETLEEPANCDHSKTLLDYQIGSTALDCSVMITLRRLNGNLDVSSGNLSKNHYVTIPKASKEHHHNNFLANATIVDLDLKKDTMAHFRKYKKQYHESKIAYCDFMESKKIKYFD